MKKSLITFALCVFVLSLFGQAPADKANSTAQTNKALEKGLGLLNKDNFTQAIEEFNGLIEKSTDMEVKKFAYIYRGFAKNGSQDFKGAIEDFDKAVEIDPTDLASYVDRAKAKLALGDSEGAEKDLELIINKEEKGEQVEAAYSILADIHYNNNQFKKAIQCYSILIKINPNNAQLYFDRAEARGLVMDIEGSIRDYDKAIELNPEYKEAYANRAVAKINLNTIKEKLKLTKEPVLDPCADLKKAQQLGEHSIDSMIPKYCGNK